MSSIDHARNILESTDCTCVFCREETVLTDNRRGVRPLLDLLESKTDLTDFAAADKVVGKAAAFLYCLLGIRTIYAGVISEPALAVLKERGIAVSFGSLVPSIRNRTQDGPCPMERAVWNLNDPQEGLAAIYETLERLRQQSAPL